MNLQKPNLLYLVHRFPYPPNRGDRIRSFHLLKFLAKYYNVYLGTLWDEKPTAREMDVVNRICKEVAVHKLGKYSRWIRAAGCFARGKSATEGLFSSPDLMSSIRSWTGTVTFEVGLAFCSSMVQFLDEADGLPVIVDLVDVDSQKWFDYADQTSGWKRWIFWEEGKRLRRLECSLPGRCKALTFVSESEADVFRAFCPNDHTIGVQNGVDLDYFIPNESRNTLVEPVSKPTCVFVGALDYRANVQGLEWFCENCWPAIHRRRPDVTLKLVGRNPVAAVRRLAEIPGVILVGQVPDVRPYVHRSAIAIAPLLTARGVQNKVLEAMAMGKVVVASEQAVEGIDCVPGKHLVSATTPEDWIKTIIELLENPSQQISIGKAGRSFVEEHHSWSASLARLGQVLDLPLNEPEPIGTRNWMTSRNSDSATGCESWG